MTLWRYGSSWDKFQHREAIAGCEESDPYRPNYWVDGDNWVVVTSSNPAARSIARALGAALYRACAAPAGVTTTTFPMRTGATGSPVEFSYPAFTERFTVTSVADPYSFPDGRAPAAGHRFVAVDLTYERESSQPFGDSYEPFRIWNDLVVHDSGIRESVYPSPAVKAIETDEMRALPGELKGSTSVTLVFEIPDSWRDPVLHASMVEDGWILGHWRLA